MVVLVGVKGQREERTKENEQKLEEVSLKESESDRPLSERGKQADRASTATKKKEN